MVKQQVSSIKETIKRNKTIVENFGYLSILQVFSTLIPLISYPYLVKVLGSELYGLVIFAQTVSIILSNIVDYGFNISTIMLIMFASK